MKNLKQITFPQLENMLVDLKNQNKSIANSLQITEVEREILKRKL